MVLLVAFAGVARADGMGKVDRVAGSDFGPQMPLTGELTPQQIALPRSTNRLGGFGATPLMVAALYGDVELAGLLLRRGAKPNQHLTNADDPKPAPFIASCGRTCGTSHGA